MNKITKSKIKQNRTKSNKIEQNRTKSVAIEPAKAECCQKREERCFENVKAKSRRETEMGGAWELLAYKLV